MKLRSSVVTLLALVSLLGANIAVVGAHDQSGSPAAAPLRQEAIRQLAAFFPKNTIVFASLSTDAATIETLDGIMARIQSALPPEALPPGTSLRISDFLDWFAEQAFEGSFSADMRPWLGDQMALGVYSPDNLFDYDSSNDSQLPGILALTITDRNGAAAFVEQLLVESYMDWERADLPDYTLFTITDYSFMGKVLVRDDVLIVASEDRFLPSTNGPLTPNLTDSPTFNNAVNLLPAESYNLVVYLDTPMIIANAIASDEEMEPGARLLLTMFVRLIGPEAIGATILDGNILTLDVVQPLGNMAGIEPLGVPFEPLPPVDPAFLGVLPASASLVVHSTDLAGVYEGLLSMGGTMMAQANMMAYDPTQMALDLMDVMLGNLTGISYQRDLRHWMTGDYALFVSYNERFDPFAWVGPANMPIEFGGVFEASDPQAARDFVGILARELQLTLRMQGVKEVKVSEERMGDVDLIVMDIYDYDQPVLQLVAGTNGALVAFGTRGAVQSVLAPSGPRFEPSQLEVLPNAGVVFYASATQLMPIVDMLTLNMSQQEGEMLRNLLVLFGGATASVASTPDGGAIARFTITLAP